MGESRGAYRVLVGKHEGRRPLVRPRHRWERVILKWILEKWDGGYGLDRSGSGQGQVVGFSECGNALLCCIKCREFLQ
jgi:hypothetical protein